MRKYLAICCAGALVWGGIFVSTSIASAATLGLSSAANVGLGGTTTVMTNSSTTTIQTTTVQVGGGVSATSGSAPSNDSGGATISVNPLDINASVGASTVTAAAQVSSSDDLKSYAVAAMKSDGNIRGMSFSDNSVEVDYREPGRLFGFIPVSVTAMANVNSDGSVTVTHPWYDFLIAKDDTNLQSTLAANVGPMATANASGQWSYATEAKIADAMKSNLESSNNVSASTQTSASASTGY